MNPETVLASFKSLLRRAQGWPLDLEKGLLDRLKLYAAFRDTDRDVIARNQPDWSQDRRLIVDPLPEKICNAFADLIFGEDPTFTAAAENDQTYLDDLVRANDLANELWRAERICVSEGEVWSRIYVVEGAEHPFIDWHSRLDVIPLFEGRELVGAAFVSRLAGEGNPETDDSVMRHFELHARGAVFNLLYAGTKSTVGELTPLSRHDETAHLPEEWRHDLPGMLCMRIPNLVGRKRRVGQSQFHGPRDLIFALNESATIGKENARLTLKQRAVLTTDMLEQMGNPDESATAETAAAGDAVLPARPRFDAGEEILIRDPLDSEMGRGGDPLQILEYSFDADALVTYDDHLALKVLTRTDVAPQLVGMNIEGRTPEAALALRTMMLNSVNAAEGKARPWDSAVPNDLIRLCALIEGMPVAAGGNGRSWTDPAGSHSMERASSLPEDEGEKSTRIGAEVRDGIKSVETGVRELHPDWSDQQIEDELEAIRRDKASSAPIFTPPAVPPSANGDTASGEGESEPRPATATG